jgi:hypothetical protein
MGREIGSNDRQIFCRSKGFSKPRSEFFARSKTGDDTQKRASSIMAGVAAWLDSQGGLDTHSLRELNALRHTLQLKSGPSE